MTANNRLKLGIALAVGGNVLFFTSAWIAWMPWPAAFKAGLWSVLFFAPEVGTLAGAAVMGRENFLRFKEAVGRFWRRLGFGKKGPSGSNTDEASDPAKDQGDKEIE